MSNVLMYCTEICPYCFRAERLLVSKGVEIRKIMIDGVTDRYDEMVSKTGRNTVPQIFIGDTHVGGFDDLSELEYEGKLDELLFSVGYTVTVG